jgi:hypothetical protein
MTPEQQRIAIAESCGWKTDKRGFGWLSPRGYYAPEPDYLNDLNAMHDAEKALTSEQLEVYCNILHKPNHGVYWAIHATASQRAEAFLRTIGKWEEAK